MLLCLLLVFLVSRSGKGEQSQAVSSKQMRDASQLSSNDSVAAHDVELQRVQLLSVLPIHLCTGIEPIDVWLVS